MATLADLFNEKSQNIYKRFSADGFQPVVIKPDTEGVFGSKSRIKNDTRSVPTVSILRDTKRVSKFLGSADGRLFIGKQLFLQTANTFENTRIYNPASVLQNVIPFVHARRHIPTQVITSIFLNPYLPGTLQPSTVNTISSKFETVDKIQALDITDRQGFLRNLGGIAKSYIGIQLKNSIKILPSAQNYYTGRPEYKAFGYFKGELTSFSPGPVLYDPQPISQRGIPKLNVVANVKTKLLSLVRAESIGPAFLAKTFGRGTILPRNLLRDPRDSSLLTQEQYNELQNKRADIFKPVTPKKTSSFVLAAAEFRKNFYDTNKKENTTMGRTTADRLKSKYFTESPNSVSDKNTTTPTKLFATSERTGIIDPYNFANFRSKNELTNEKYLYTDVLNYSNIEKIQKDADIINFYFKRVEQTANPVQFRALISSIKESIRPEFNEQRYVGRTERFVTYGGAKRGVSISFNIVAFSEFEVDGMWSRVNYLSGLAFPQDVKNGFMVPPLFKFTIGKLYDNQPCYIESLDYDFLDETITFNEREVPFAINVNMQLSILEKRSKFYDSPFYKITENAESTISARSRLPSSLLLGVRI